MKTLEITKTEKGFEVFGKIFKSEEFAENFVKKIKDSHLKKHKISWGTIVQYNSFKGKKEGKILESSITEKHKNNELTIYVSPLKSCGYENILYADIIKVIN